MSAPYTGKPAGDATDGVFTPTSSRGLTGWSDLAVLFGVDGDGLNIESVNKALRVIVNALARIDRYGGFLDVARTWTEKQTFNQFEILKTLLLKSPGSDAEPDIANNERPSANKMRTLLKVPVGTGGIYARLLQPSSSASLVVTINARWDNATEMYYADTPGARSARIALGEVSSFRVYTHADATGFPSSSFDASSLLFIPYVPAGAGALPNAFHLLSFPKAWTHFTLVSGANPTVHYAPGVASVTRQGANWLRVTFTTPFKNKRFSLLSCNDANLNVQPAGLHDSERDTTYMDVRAIVPTGATYSIGTDAPGGASISLFFYGEQ